jgi:hypothetical protein
MATAKAKLLSPRGYLSYTQIDLWWRSPQTYIKNYMLGEEHIINNAYMDTGKAFASAMETGEATGEELTDLVASLLPRYDTPEKELVAPLATPQGTFMLLGKLDTFNGLTVAFREYKTGTVKWTQNRANKHSQLLHYAALIWLTYKRLPASVHLDWSETLKDDNGQAIFTGRIESFEVKMTMTMILEYLSRATKAAVQIDAAYRKQLAQTYEQF